MRRLLVTAFALVTFLVPAVAVAGTATSLTGTAEWSGPTFDSPVTITVIHGTFQGPLGSGTYEGTLVGTPAPTTGSCGPVCQSVTGSITFSGNRGSFTGVVQPGSLVGLEDIASHSWRFFGLTLRVTDGTRGYTNADGLLSLSYTSTWTHFFDMYSGQFINTITDEGTLTGNLR